MSRFFHYLENENEFVDGFYIVKKIIRDIREFDLSLVEDKEYFIKLQQEVDEIDKELGDDYFELQQKITDDIISPRVVNYYYEHNHTYPDDVSPIGDRIIQLFNRIFEIEDEVQLICAKVWNKLLTPFEQIENGMPFSIVGHSGMGYIVTPSSKRYNNSEYQNTASYSCSLFNEHSINVFSSNLVMVFDINPLNFIVASYYDCATSKVGYSRGIKTLTSEEDGLLTAGYTHVHDIDKIITKSECPTSIIKKINTDNTGRINEFVLNKTKSIPQGLVIFSSGYDFPLIEYLFALQMQHDYMLNLKVINRSLYIPSELSKEEKIAKLDSEIIKVLSNLGEELITLEILDSFIENVIIPLKLDTDIEERIIYRIEEYKKSKNLHTM